MAMFDPPPGFDDLIGDCQTPPGFGPLAVDGVGVVQARKPRPDALADLAMSNHPTISGEQRQDRAARFVRTHLGDGEFARLLTAMLDDELPSDTVTRVGEALATWGTARPYNAVVILAVMAAKNWRAIRYRLLDMGIADPMVLPSLHPILDVTEQAVLESFSSDNPKQDRAERDRFTDLLYRPTVTPGRGAAGKALPAAPEGFSEAESSASFDALVAAVR